MKTAFYTFAIILASLQSFAQPHGPERREKVESMKIGFLTEKLDLTPDEAQKFWPVYNEYRNKIEALRKTRKKDMKDDPEQMETLSDKEIESIVDNEIVFRQKELDIIKEYHSKFKAVLPIKKVGRLYRAEEMFKRELLRKIKEDGRGPR
jgi:hypothetical protein